MKRFLVIAAGLSIALVCTQSAWAKAPHRGPQAAPRPAMQGAARNQAVAGRRAAHHANDSDSDDFRFARTPYAAYPWYGPAYGVGYAPVIGYMPSGFAGNFGGGGMSMTFFGPGGGGQDHFSSPAYGHWGAFGK